MLTACAGGSPSAPPENSGGLAPTPNVSSRPSATSASTPATATAEWQRFYGNGYGIDVPQDWQAASPSIGDQQLISPTRYPFLEIQDLGAWPDTDDPAVLAGIYDFSGGSEDVVRSQTTIDGETAVLVRFHHTSEDTGIVYYRLPAFVFHGREGTRSS